MGFFLAYLYGRKTTDFRWSEYLAMIAAPLVFIVVASIYLDKRIFSMFLISSAIGFLAEGIIGFTYDKILGKRLWTYNRLSVGGYTSYLSIPLWGVAGVIFLFVSKLIGF